MHRRSLQDGRLAGLLLLATLLLYTSTLLPGLGEADTAEFQRVLATRGLAHPTGYPLYTLLGWLWLQLPAGDSMAWRANLFSAVCSALTIAMTFLSGRVLRLPRTISASAALLLATSLAFWVQATRAEVYALAILLQSSLILALLLWRAGRLPLWVAGLCFGLGLAHHRMIVLLVPGCLLFVALTRPLALRALGLAALAALAPALLYVHVLLQLPASPERWQLFTTHIFAGSFQGLLKPERLIAAGMQQPLVLWREQIWAQLLPVGVPLQLLGALRLLRRERPAACCLLLSYALIFVFCGSYDVADIDVFLIPLYAIGALLLGHGLAALLGLLPEGRRRSVGALTLLLPLTLLGLNWGTLRTVNTAASETFARSAMAHPFPAGAVVVGDWSRIEAMHYLQAVEKQHPDIELVTTYDPTTLTPNIRQWLAAGRPVYFLEPAPQLGLDHLREGRHWRIQDRPLTLDADIEAGIKWSIGIELEKFSLTPGPYPPGTSIPLILQWSTSRKLPHDYTLFVHVVNAEGRVWAQQDRPPSRAPTGQWRPGKRYDDLYAPLLSPQAPPGRYKVRIGWYRFPAMEQLALDGVPSRPGISVTLGEIEVR